MRRQEKEIATQEEIDEVIRRAPVCRLALSDNDTPYVVPVCFGYEGGALYFHSAPEGRKLDILMQNGRVCFEMDIDTRIVVSDSPCNWSLRYRSVIGFGEAAIVADPEEKRRGLDAIMRHYSGPVGQYNQDKFEKTIVIKVTVSSVTGKKSGY
jgi:uncharacterized protein